MRQTIVTLAAALAAHCAAVAQAPAPDNTGMEMDAQAMTKSIAMGWNLGNSFESAGADWDGSTQQWKNPWITDRNEWETGWGNPKTTKAMIDAVAAAGFDAIRIPVRWEPHVTDKATMKIDPKWMSRIKEVVDWSLAAGMTVMLNTHHEKWLESRPYNANKEEINSMLGKLWTQIATEFRDYPQTLIFAGTNETTVNWAAPTAENQAVQNSYHQTFVDAVRATGGKNYYRNLIIQTYACAPEYGFDGTVIPNDVVEKRLSVEFHYYQPWDYCGDWKYRYWGQKYADMGKNVSPSGNEATIKNIFARARQVWWDKGLGVVIGEYGVTDRQYEDKTAELECQKYYMETFVSEARKNGFATFLWDNSVFENNDGGKGERYGLFDRTDGMKSNKRSAILEGIIAGAKSSFEDKKPQGGNVDYTQGAKEIWSGNADLNWGSGLQLTISAKEFAHFTDNATMVLCYTQKAEADYQLIQIMGADWSELSGFTTDGTSYAGGDFKPADHYFSTAGDRQTPITLTGAALAKAKTSGLVIQGFGVTLTKVLIAQKANSTALGAISAIRDNGDIYDLAGRKVAKPQPGEMYVRGGKLIMVR